MIKVNLVIVGGGPAGLAAAKSAYDAGERVEILSAHRTANTVHNFAFRNHFAAAIYFAV